MATPRASVRLVPSSKPPAVEIEVDDRVVRVSNPDRVYFPESGATKLDLVEYYLAVGPRHRQRALRAAVHAAPVPQGPGRRQGAPEAAARGRAALGRDGAAALPALEPHRRRALRHRARQRDLGGADVDGRVPPLEQPARRHREARRVADRPRPRPAVRLRARCGGSPTSSHEVLDELGAVGFPKTSGSKGMHVYVRIPPDHGFKDVRRAALAFAREVERRAPDDVTTTWWTQGPRPAPALRRLQPERARPHHRGGVLRPRAARRPGLDADPVGRGRRRRPARLHDLHRARSGSPSSATCTPTSTTTSSTSRRCWSGPSATSARAREVDPTTP